MDENADSVSSDTTIFGLPAVVIRPVEVGVLERLGKFNRLLDPGFHFIIPVIDSVRIINMTEQMINVEPQEVITKDKLNVKIDAVVYYRVIDAKSALYNVNNHEAQTVMLAKTSLRAVIGGMSLEETVESRAIINSKLQAMLENETKTYGVDVLRCELQDIIPPKNVQEAMNEVVRTANLKLAAVNEATAAETKADGIKRASIKESEGKQKSAELEALGKATAITALAEAEAGRILTVNTAINKSFTGQAVEYKKLETAAISLENNTKVIIGNSSNLVNVIGETAGIVPVKTA